jgi:hypothetical protein
MTEIKAIPIELIRLDGGTQIRDCKTMQTKIAEYATAMAEGNQFPPLTVFWDGEHYWLADGFHRLGAYNVVMQALKLPGLDIECEVIEGPLRDAIIYACGVNAVHGMPRTVPDKQNAVRTILTNPLVALDEHGVPWNDHQIARICNVNHKMVGRHRVDIAAELAKAQEGGGYLGHVLDSGERTVTRGGTTYTMNTVAKWRAELTGRTPSQRAYVVGAIPSSFMRSWVSAISVLILAALAGDDRTSNPDVRI